MQGAPGLVAFDRCGDPMEDRSGVESGLHAHDADACLRITGEDGALDRRGAAPTRQQRGMDVDATEPGRFQDCARQSQTIGDHDHQVSPELAQLLDGLGIVLESLGLIHCQTAIERQCLHWAHLESASASGRAVGLGIDTDHFVPGIEQGSEAGDSKVRRAGENEAQRFHQVARRSVDGR
jgi:hypothetical protein